MIKFSKRMGDAPGQLELAAEIAETLFQLGGAAHQDQVIDIMLADRRVRGAVADQRLRLDIAEAFDAYCDVGGYGAHGPPLFTLPFGKGSRRWALREASARHGSALAWVVLPARQPAP